MKIGSPDTKPAAGPLELERKAGGPDRKTAAGKAEQSSAQVEISATASELRSGATDASFDAEKVARIAQAIRDGKFTVDPGKIADKLISNAKELLGPSNS
jgi:negative regulator of flagellin synthesis FlgM